MKAMAMFGGAGTLTATLTGGPVAIVFGNVAILAVACAILMATLNLSKG